MMFQKYSDEEIRGHCRQVLETLEYWLKQLIEEELSKAFGPNYFDATDKGGSPLISKKRTDEIKGRQKQEPTRFIRLVDAAFLDDIIALVCHQELYAPYFRKYFETNYPNGVNELRTVLNRLTDPRNRLSHTNPISTRQAEQVICYSHDIIDSIKNYYTTSKTHMDFNVPRIIRFKDSFGNQVHFNQNSDGQLGVNYKNDSKCYLRPGDTLEIEVEIDQSFERTEYTVKWKALKPIPNFGNVTKIQLLIEEKHVTEDFNIQCIVISNKSWHRLYQGYDDLLLLWYRILPPINQ
jgi:hypothetical protein